MNNLSERINSIDALRGIAALSVCVFHITYGNTNYLLDSNLLKIIGKYGWLGVEIFFVISGFIIPYSMYRNGYTIDKVKTFITRRILRIDPPYFIAIILVITFNYISTLSPYYRGSGFELDGEGLLYHIGYLNGIMERPWLSPVFWTLAIEFQFYILMALFFPLLVNRSIFIRYLFIICVLGASLIFTSNIFFFKYSPLFVIGIMAFSFNAKMISVREFIFSVMCVLTLAYIQLGLLPVLAAVVTLLMMHLPLKVRFLEFLGMISYSLYLIHISVGGRIINLSINFVENELMRSLITIIAIGFSIGFAYLFYLLIEAPSIKLSKSTKYNGEMKQKRPAANYTSSQV